MNQKIITYYLRGEVERGTGKGYEWRRGYSEGTADGAVLFPWMTARECQQDARKRGAVAQFVNQTPDKKP